MGKDSGEGWNLRALRGLERIQVSPVVGNHAGGLTASPAGSPVAGDFIPKAAMVRLFPKKESVTV